MNLNFLGRTFVVRRFALVAVFVFVVSLFLVNRAFAANGINKQIAYQGKLLNSTGAAVADGVYNMKLSLYSTSSGGTAFWTASGTASVPTAIPVTVQDGLFTIMLGDTSAAGGWQNALDGLNWNEDSLFLGVTIESDSEMSPRKRLGSVPQAFNALQLQGMYASSTASGGQSLFVINQTENNAATSTRVALDVRTSGSSLTNDLLIRGVDDSAGVNLSVFTVNRAGSVTSTGNFAFQGSGTSTLDGSLSVGGNVSSTLLYAQSAVLAALSATSLNASGLIWTNATGTNLVLTDLSATTFSLGGGSIGNLTATNVTSTNLDVTGASTSTFSGNLSILGTASLQALSATGISASSLLITNATTTNLATSDFFAVHATTTNLYSDSITTSLLNLSNLTWTNATGTYTTSTDLYASLLRYGDSVGTNATTTNLAVIGSGTSTFLGSINVGGSVSTTDAYVNGYFQANGRVSLGDISSDFIELNGSINSAINLSTDSIIDLASSDKRIRTGYFVDVTSTGITATTVTTTNLAVVGSGTSTFLGNATFGTSTVSIAMHPSFGLDGNDIFVGGNIGSASSVYTNGAFIAGNSTYYNQGSIVNTSGNFVVTSTNHLGLMANSGISLDAGTNLDIVAGADVNIFSTASMYLQSGTDIFLTAADGRAIRPTNDGTTTLGVELARFNGYFLNTTTTNAITTNATATRLTVLDNADVSINSASTIPRVAVVDTLASPADVRADDAYVYLISTSTNRVEIYNVASSTTPTLISSVLNGSATLHGIDIRSGGEYATVGLDGQVGFASRYSAGSLSLAPTVRAVRLVGSKAYVLSENALSIVDIANIEKPKVVGTFQDPLYFPYAAVSLDVQQGRVYAAVRGGGADPATLLAISANDLGSLSAYATTSISGDPRELVVQGEYSYVATDAGLSIVDNLGSGGLPVEVSTLTVSGGRHLAVSGNYVFLTSDAGVAVIDVHDRAHPALIQTIAVTNAVGVAVRGRSLYVTDSDGQNQLFVYQLPGVDAASVSAASVEAGMLTVLRDGRIGNQLDVLGGLFVGEDGIFTRGGLTAGSQSATSVILGSLFVGTSTKDVEMNTGFGNTNHDLFVGGNIGSASSVYTNGAFIAGTSSAVATYYNPGSIVNLNNDGFTVTSSHSVTLSADENLLFQSGLSMKLDSAQDVVLKPGHGLTAGYSVIPQLDGITSLGTSALRFNGNFRDTTTTNATTTNSFSNQSVMVAVNSDSVLTSLPVGVFASSLGAGADTPTSTEHLVDDGGRFLFALSFSTNQILAYDTSSSTNPGYVPYPIATQSVGPNDIAVVGKYVYFTSEDGSFTIMDWAESTITGKITLPAARGLLVQGSYAYIKGDDHVYVVDISTPAHPRVVSSVTATGANFAALALGNYPTGPLYAFDTATPQLSVFGFADVNSPSTFATFPGFSANVVVAQGSHLFVASSNGFDIYDALYATDVKLTSSVAIVSGAFDIKVVGNLAFVLTINGVSIYDVSDTTAPRLLKSIAVSNADSILVKERTLFVGRNNGDILAYLLPGIETTTLSSGSADIGKLIVKADGSIGHNLHVVGGVTVGLGGITSEGAISGGSSQVTSTILGNFMVGTSSVDVAMHAGFGLDGDDLFVGGNIGSASSVYTNGAFIAGNASTYYGSGYITNYSGDFSASSSQAFNISASGGFYVTSTGSMWLKGGADVNMIANTTGRFYASTLDLNGSAAASLTTDGYLALRGSTGIILNGPIVSPNAPGELLGDDGNYWNASFGNSTTTNSTTTNAHVTNLLDVSGDKTTSLAEFNNVNGGDTAWGAYVNRLLVGAVASATGTTNYAMVISSGGSRDGLCIKQDSGFCPNIGATPFSLMADDHIGAVAFDVGGFDLAERYPLVGTATSSDVLVMEGVDPVHVKVSSGIPYDPHIIGILSTAPGYTLGFDGAGVPVALAGRVPTKVSTVNGAIVIGDALTTSEYPGVAMKATKPGMILGYALEPATATSTIEVFVKTGYSAGSILGTDGQVARLTDDLTVDARSVASATTSTQDSWGLTFRGSAYDMATISQPSFSLLTNVVTPTSSMFVIRNASSSNVLSVDQLGNASIAGDVVVGGKLYPSGRNGAQTDKYVFLDDSSTSTQYIATNADGWQANDSYDFAERYYSPDHLDMGDLVIASDRGQFHVQRSLDEGTMLMGIVSTRPAFVAGKPGEDTYPIALAGRVPTKVSTMNGAIKVGDPLAPSSIPGTAVKAIKAGPIVGLALESYDMGTVGKIEVFVNPGWWGGPEVSTTDSSVTANQPTGTMTTNSDGSVAFRGFAVIESGSKQVHVTYDSVLSYPNIQVTPRGQIHGGWWTDNYTDVGFDIFMSEDQNRDVTFAWGVEGTPTGARVFRSDGTYALVNPTTGEALVQTVATSTHDVSPVTHTTTTLIVTEPVDPPVLEVATTTPDIVEPSSDIVEPSAEVVPADSVQQAPVVQETPVLDAVNDVQNSSSTTSTDTP